MTSGIYLDSLMKKFDVMNYAVLAFLVIILIGVFIFVSYGFYQKLRFTQQTCGGEWIAYLEFKGEYKQSGKYMDEVYQVLLDEYQIQTKKGIGIYYDNPKELPTDQLRAEAGCIIDEADAKALMNHNKLKIKQLETSPCLITNFPYKGKMSVIVGVLKVYPAMQMYLQQNKLAKDGPVIEIYDQPAKQIQYRRIL